MRGRSSVTITLSALAGAVFALTAPPTNLYAAPWIAMAGLAYLLEEDLPPPDPPRRRWLAGAARGAAFGTAANVVALRFVPDVVARFTPLPWAAGALALVLLSGLQSLRWLVAAMISKQLGLVRVPTWLAFPTGIYVGTFVPVVFPWTPAGGVTPWPAMVQLGELIGERGVTLLMALSSALFATCLRRFVHRRGSWEQALAPGLLGVFLPAATLAYGVLRMRSIEALIARAPHVTVGLVQPSVAALERWEGDHARGILDRLTALTEDAERRGASLTIWPEGAYPKPLAHASRRCPIGAWAVLPAGVHGPVLTGLIMLGANGDTFNSAAVCSADGALSAPYDKLHLLLFGETVPYFDRIRWIRDTFARGTGMVQGERNVVLRSRSIEASVLNCFEDTLPQAGRTAMADHPNVLVNITNDSWFAGSAESELHLRLAAMRAIESRRDLVRAVNFGPTSWVDAAGRIRARYPGDFPGVLLAQPALLDGPLTFYSRWGDAPMAVIMGLLVGASAFLRRNPPSSS